MASYYRYMKESMKLLDQIIEAAELSDSATHGNVFASFKLKQKQKELERTALEGLSGQDQKVGVSWMVFHLRTLKELINQEEGGNES